MKIVANDCVAEAVENNTATPQENREICWFAMRDLTRCNAKLPAYKLLGEKGIELFTPMKTIIRTVGGTRVRQEVPFMQDLLFVHSSREQLDPLVNKVNTLQYRFQRGGKYCDPMVVPKKDMERFIFAVSTAKSARYYLPSEIIPAMIGRKVRIVGGPLNSLEGHLLAIRGSKVKRLMVSLPNFITAGVEVEPEYIQLWE